MGSRAVIFHRNTGLLKYRIGRAKTKNAPETRLLASANQKNGMTRRVISGRDCEGMASFRIRRLRSTILPMTTAIPRMCTVWMTGGNPGIFCSAHRAPS